MIFSLQSTVRMEKLSLLNKSFSKLFNRIHSIRTKVVLLNSIVISMAIIVMTVVVLFLVQKQINSQVHFLLQNKAVSLHKSIEQRIEYLFENTQLLTKNELMINAMTDKDGKKSYLPKLIDNFMDGKDVEYLDVVDLYGTPVFQTQDRIPTYNSSSDLRTALAVGQTSIYLKEKTNQIVIISPIKYYDTTQGAVIVSFNINDIVKRTVSLDKDTYIKLLHNNKTIYEYNIDKNKNYESYQHNIYKNLPLLKDLGVGFEIGISDSVYNAPVKDSIFVLSIIGVMFVAIGILVAALIANYMIEPILTLYKRVKASSDDNNVQCSPLGTNDELEELAKAFDESMLKLQYLAEHDTLTKLPNRLLFIDRLNQAIHYCNRYDKKLAVVFIDLDRFKEVNDSFGHYVGDNLLMKVSARLKKIFRNTDSIARIGGDEFLLLIDMIENEDIVADVLQKIVKAFEDAFMLDKNRQVYITASMGISVYPSHGKTADELIKNADAAMYKAKDAGRNTYKFYTNDMTQKALERISLETELRDAIKNEEFEVFFQPQVNMVKNKIVGMEALIRWRHPKKGLVPPGKFIPLAEETGMIVEIDRWVMYNAMRQFVEWENAGFDPGVLSVNLSMIQIDNKDFLYAFELALKNSKISPDSVMLEVTETQVMRNPEHAIEVLNKLKSFGIKLAVDDFGTGHSSLSYLKRLPIDKIKIDQSFVFDVPNDKEDMELVAAIIAISKSLDLSIIAEGVETSEQSRFLQQKGCFEAQGYFYYKPMEASKVTDILKSDG